MDYSLGNSAQQKALRLKVKPKWKLKNRAVPRIRAIKDASGFKCICLSYGPRPTDCQWKNLRFLRAIGEDFCTSRPKKRPLYLLWKGAVRNTLLIPQREENVPRHRLRGLVAVDKQGRGLIILGQAAGHQLPHRHLLILSL